VSCPDATPAETAAVQRTYLAWLRRQRLRRDLVGDVARLAERGRRQIGRSYSFHDLDRALKRAVRRYPNAREAFYRSLSEFFEASLRRMRARELQ
jgi:hypothetical protein